METAIHIEIDALFFLILFRIAWQSAKNVSQQMGRVLFRYTVYGILANLLLDMLWRALDGRLFPGAFMLNGIVNVLFFTSGIVIGCIWYLYVLETIGCQINRRLVLLMMLPGAAAMVLNLISLKTGWIFYISKENKYMRGPLFCLQMTMAVSVLLVPMIHCLICLLRGKAGVNRKELARLCGFYLIPVLGNLVTMPFPGMPGTWTCAAVSIVLLYIDGQDREIVRDSLTGMNNRKMLPAVFEDYARRDEPGTRLYLLMMDLDDFKGINDTYGHSMGDQALIRAARVFARSLDGRKAMLARVGGDEFLIMTFFSGEDEAAAFRRSLESAFDRFNEEKLLPIPLHASIGWCAYEAGESLHACMARADAALYRDKQRRRVGRGVKGAG